MQKATLDESLLSARQHFEQLKIQFLSLSERAMRREILGEKLLHLPPEIQVELIYLIVRDSATDPQTAFLMIAFQDQVDAHHQLSYDQLRKIYELSYQCGYTEVQRLLFSASTHARSGQRSKSGQEQTALGMRKFMARAHNPQILEKLLLDPDPSVIHNLLYNPRITEREVLRICSHRPNHPDILAKVAQHPRWFNRYRVKLAIIQNPHISTNIALQILPLLQSPDLKSISQLRNIHPQIIISAKEILQRRLCSKPVTNGSL
jgi:hypothetical protein